MTASAESLRYKTRGGELRAGLLPGTFRAALPVQEKPASEETLLQVGDYEL